MTASDPVRPSSPGSSITAKAGHAAAGVRSRPARGSLASLGHSASRSNLGRASHVLPGLRSVSRGMLGLSLAAMGLTGCGAPVEEAGNGLTPFGGVAGASASTSSGNGNGSAGSAGGGGASPSGSGAAATCVAGAVRCDGSRTLETCNATGTGFNTSTCDGATVCLAGACRQPTCEAGRPLCLGSEIHSCNADGKSTTLTSVCNAGEQCIPATITCQPQLCEPLLATCNGNVATRCDATGLAYDFRANADCAGQTCMAGACRASEATNPINPSTPITQACTPNQVLCNGNVLNRCNAAGTQVTPQDCAATGGTCGMLGGAPSCIAPGCTPGTISCEGANTISTCGANGSEAITRCPDGTNCTGAGQCTPVQCSTTPLLTHNGNGGVTVYWFAQGTISSPRQEGQDVHCGFNGTRANNDDGGQNDRVAYIQDPALFGAMNLGEYNGASACGACVRLTQGGRNVTVTVADSCNPAINNNGTCTTGHIDLSRTAFQQLTGQSTGDINGISWQVVPCDTVDTVQFLLKKPADPYWNQFLVVNHRFPIAKAEVLMEDGRWLAARRELYNYWLPPEGDGGMGGKMGTYRVRVTDINGGIIEEQLELRGGLQGGSGQFACQ